MKFYAAIMDGKIMDVLDADDECLKWAGDYLGHCGGCGNCMLMQCQHWGTETVPVILKSHQTLGDWVGEWETRYSDDRRETEKRAAVRASEEPVKGDEAESEQQRRERIGK